MTPTVRATDGGAARRPDHVGMTSRLQLSHTLSALGLLYLLGVALALSGGLASLGDAIASGSKVNAPLPIIAVQLLGGAVAVRAKGRVAIIGAILLLAACTLSLAAVAFDGDLGAQGLSAGQVAYQVLITATTATTWMLAVRGISTRRAAGSRTRR
jgi:hypothetical protein